MHKKQIAASDVIPRGMTGCRGNSFAIVNIGFVMKSCVFGSPQLPPRMFRKANYLIINQSVRKAI